MWGGDDPDCRKPMVWPEQRYQPETYTSVSRYSDRDSVIFDHALFAHYQKLLELRKHHPAVRAGDFTALHAEEDDGIYAFQRRHEEDTVIAVFNVSIAERTFTLPVAGAASQVWQEVLTGASVSASNHELAITIAPRTAQIWTAAGVR